MGHKLPAHGSATAPAESPKKSGFWTYLILAIVALWVGAVVVGLVAEAVKDHEQRSYDCSNTVRDGGLHYDCSPVAP